MAQSARGGTVCLSLLSVHQYIFFVVFLLWFPTHIGAAIVLEPYISSLDFPQLRISSTDGDSIFFLGNAYGDTKAVVAMHATDLQFIATLPLYMPGTPLDMLLIGNDILTIWSGCAPLVCLTLLPGLPPDTLSSAPT